MRIFYIVGNKKKLRRFYNYNDRRSVVRGNRHKIPLCSYNDAPKIKLKRPSMAIHTGNRWTNCPLQEGTVHIVRVGPMATVSDDIARWSGGTVLVVISSPGGTDYYMTGQLVTAHPRPSSRAEEMSSVIYPLTMNIASLLIVLVSSRDGVSI